MTTIAPGLDLPTPEILRRLALSESGFVFDPVSGNSFTVNETGLVLLRLLQRETDLPALMTAIAEDYDVAPAMAERDLIEFSGSLRQYLKS
ncbi:MAG: PqqD family protein [Rhodocyclaceae bacterium]|nr:PqqD family protein [Rhodocyclaceae bacterium]